jgi:predicted dehydrogenase
MREVRIAVTGAGVIGRRHIEEIQRSRSARLAGIVDPSPLVAELAKKASVPFHTSLTALLAAERPDGMVLATPNALHVEQGLQCIAAGVPVLVEKPLAHTVEQGERLVDAAERAGVALLVGHHRRHSPILHKAVEIVQSGVLGRLVGVMGSAAFYKPDADGYFDGANAWRRQRGGGPILINMIHEAGNLRALAGEIVAVQAFSSSAVRGFEVEDTAAVNLRFAGGALGTFLLSDTAACAKSWEQTTQEDKAFASYPDEDAYVVIGTTGSLGIPTMRLKSFDKTDKRSWRQPFRETTFALERDDPLRRQIEHFAAVVRGEAKPLVSGRDGLQNLRVVEAIAEAARTGQTIHVPTQ